MNRIIQGDSLDHLDALIDIDLILIDPPYNEGKSKGKYQDLWTGPSKHFPWINDKHGKYIDFLYELLVKSHKSLKDNGCLFLFIGESEYHYIRIVLDFIFQEENYLGTLIWESSSNQQKSKKIDRNHEYVLVYTKDASQMAGLFFHDDTSPEKQLYDFAQKMKSENIDFEKADKLYLEFFLKLKKQFKNISPFKYIHPESYIPFYLDNAGDPRNGSKIQLPHPVSKNLTPIPRNGKGWSVSPDYLNKMKETSSYFTLRDGKIFVPLAHDKKEDLGGIVFGQNETMVPSTCRLYSRKTDKEVLKTTGHVYKANDKKEGIPRESGFETVKPVDFLVKIIKNFNNKNALILDFFAGSGTTAIATEKANQEDNGTRQWILIEQNLKTVEGVIVPRLSYFNITNYEIQSIPKKSIYPIIVQIGE
jgi:adenine-specific DNA-methyltransferase